MAALLIGNVDSSASDDEIRDLLARHGFPPGDSIEHMRRGAGQRRLDARERIAPQLLALLVPPDIEEALGTTNGDLDGGEIAPDQMFGFRPFVDRKAPYTPVGGLYLAGGSSPAAPLGGCVAGAVAAEAVFADLAGGKLP